MTVQQWTARFEQLLDDLDSDDDLGDADYLDVLDSVSSDADSRADAKREEMKSHERDED